MSKLLLGELYFMLTLIFFIKAQDSNQLIELNNKPFPVFLSSTKNETHYIF